jgi:hypothetical protein
VNKLVVVLAASTAASAGTALYYRHELMEERARVAQVEAGATLPATTHAPTTPAAAPAQVAPPVVASPGTPGPEKKDRAPLAPANAQASAKPDAAVPPPQMDETRKAEMRQRAGEFLKKYDDPEGRVVLRDEALRRTRMSLKGFDKEANLDAATFEKLVQMSAEQELERRAMQSRCMADTQCDGPTIEYRELNARNQAAIAALIGEDGRKQMENWARSMSERRAATSLAGRLPANAALTSSQSAALISALTTGREAAIQEYAANRQRMTGYGNVDGLMVLYSPEAPSVDERVASARIFSQRMRDQAATVLRGEQLMTFNQMQDELLLDLQRHLRRQELDKREGS